jgi:hypothetical protein
MEPFAKLQPLWTYFLAVFSLTTLLCGLPASGRAPFASGTRHELLPRFEMHNALEKLSVAGLRHLPDASIVLEINATVLERSGQVWTRRNIEGIKEGGALATTFRWLIPRCIAKKSCCGGVS